jgi:2-(1,2-epoxy-1,2-dihydrophenyl)acetyl-CoA isomerase
MAAVETSTSAAVRTIRLNRPEVLNAFDPPMLHDLRAGVNEASGDPAVRAIVLTGGPRAFCTGEDLKTAQTLDVAQFRTQMAELQELATALRDAPKPVIGAVAGPAYGGGLELAVNCDVRVAATSAHFACPEPKWAMTITNGASVLLPRLVGDGWAREIMLLGTVVDAETALRIGLVTRVVPDEELESSAFELARGVAELDPDALARTKRMLNEDPASWQATLDSEADAVVAGFASPAARERLASFGKKA